LTEEKFIKFLEVIAKEKKFDFEQMIVKLISVELPGNPQETKASNQPFEVLDPSPLPETEVDTQQP
jgi:preprotein translocase subunit SecB